MARRTRLATRCSLFLALFSVGATLPTTAAASSSSAALPNIDFSALGSAAVVGNFQGLDFYDPTASHSVAYSSTASTLFSRTADGTLSPLGLTNTGGSIKAICQTPSGVVFVGGSFTDFGGVPSANIASYDPASETFAALGSGVSGPVSALSCNGTTVYVGGSFTAPVGLTEGYAGNVASWDTTSQSWSPLPFSGLNGPVETISPSLDGRSLFFGGSFSTSFVNGTIANVTTLTRTTTNISLVGNGTIYASLGSSLSPISLNTSDFWASPTTYTSGFGRSQYIFCPRRGDGIAASWMLVDGQLGYFIVRFYRPLAARGIRIGNTFYKGNGTKTFNVVSIPDNQILKLSYASVVTDPTSPLASCSDDCPLAHDPSVPYQDFIFDENVSMTGFVLNVNSFYGAAGGLHLLQLLSEGAYDYAVEANNASPCMEGLGATVQSGLTTSGNWTEKSVVSGIAGTTQPVLYGHISAGATSPTLTWTPTINQNGQYTIQFYTPACEQQEDCNLRTTVQLAVTPNAPGSTTTTTTINQAVGAQNVQTPIYSGELSASALPNGGVTVVLSLAGEVANNVGNVIVGDLISLVAASTNGTTNTSVSLNSTTFSNSLAVGRGLFEYALVDTGTFGDAVPASEGLDAASATPLQNATAIDSLAFGFAESANISTVVSVGEGAATQVFIGGEFVYAKDGVTSTNVVSRTASGVVPAPNGGLNGQVLSLVELEGVLYAAGTFTSSADGAVANLLGAASWRYATPGTGWEALGGTAPSVAGHVSALGVVSTGTNTDAIVAVGGGGSGYAFIDPSSGAWNSSVADVAFFVGNVSSFGGAPEVQQANATAYFAGLVFAASSNAVPGGAMLSSSRGTPKITSLGYGLGSSSSSSNASNSTGTASTSTAVKRWMSSRFSPRSSSPRLTALERAFNLLPRVATAPANLNLTLPSSLSPSGDSEVLAGAYWKNTMLLGGRFTTSDGIANLGLYDINSSKMAALTGETIDGTVMTLAVASDVAWIGGEFTTASGRQGLTTYDLQKGAVVDAQAALEGYSGTTASVNVIVPRPGYSSTVIIGGAFAAAGDMACQSICSYDQQTEEWSTFSTGLPGVVGAISFAGSKSEYLLAAGNFVVNGTTAYLAQWSYSSSSWTLLGNSSSVPGPATAVSADGTDDAKIFLAGASSTTNSPYLMYWNNSAWSDVSQGALASGSGIQQLVFVPLSNDHSGNSIIESDRMLMVSGDLKINETSVSTALFDGAVWHPYLLASSSTGAGAVSKFFYSITDFSLSRKHMAVGLVILISIAIALGVIFLGVIIGLLFALTRKKEQSAYPVQPTHRGSNEKVHNMHRPTSLLTAVGAATAVMLDGKNTEKRQSPIDHDSIVGEPMSLDGQTSMMGSDQFEESTAQARYSFQAEHAGELSVSAGEELVILEATDSNWYLVANGQGQRGLMPSSYIA